MVLCIGMLPLQYVQRFFPFPLKIVGRLLKFTGYVHFCKSLSGNILDLILKNKIATILSWSSRNFTHSKAASQSMEG